LVPGLINKLGEISSAELPRSTLPQAPPCDRSWIFDIFLKENARMAVASDFINILYM
jgi:hypothetical protein